jgi:cytochrome P450
LTEVIRLAEYGMIPEHTGYPRVDAPYVAELVQLTNYDEIVEVLRSPRFRQGAFTLSGPHMLHDSVSVLHGQAHFERRRAEAHLFSKAALARYAAEHLELTIDRTLANISAAHPASVAQADLVDLTWHMLCEVAGTVVGLDGIEDPPTIERLIGYTKKFGNALTVEWSTGDQEEILREGLRTRAEFVDDIFGPSAARRLWLVERYRQGLIAEDDLPLDLITRLFLHQGADLDQGMPLRETTLFLVAATQTTVQAFPHFIMHLEQWFAQDPERRELVRSDPQLLQHAAYESLRLFVASPVRIREAIDDMVLSSGRRVRAGERVGLLLQGANSDIDAFGPDADTFNPMRDCKNRPRWGLAFGNGPHMCIGRPLVTGVRGGTDESEGTMAAMARRLYAAGMRLNPDMPPVRDGSTYYDAFSSVPVLFDDLPVSAKVTDAH